MAVHLFTTSNPADIPAVFLPWLAFERTPASRPSLVVVPSRADAYFLKLLALHAGTSVLGVRFITPSELRDLLAHAPDCDSIVPLREHLRLLLATAAEKFPDDAAARAVALAPDHMLKAHDLLNASGWSFASHGPAALREVAIEFERLLEECGFQLMADADRSARAHALASPARFDRMFVFGFNALHWPLWELLAAGVHSAGNAVVCLSHPRDEAGELDEAWIGTWEEEFGSADPVPQGNTPRPFADLLSTPEQRGSRDVQDGCADQVRFLLGRDTAEHARAIVAQAFEYLSHPACTRLGILFPAANALSRRVSELLSAHGIAHDDALAHVAPGPFEDPVWAAWLELQDNPRTPVLLRFLRALPDTTAILDGMALRDVDRHLRRVLESVLIDDFRFLAAWLEARPKDELSKRIATALRALPVLPEKASLSEFCALTGAIFVRLGWQDRLLEMQRVAADWHRAPNLPLSRRSWLRWLDEVLKSWRAERSEHGKHPYSRVHLLPYAQGESQAWSHLIATGLNEGSWPPSLEDAGWLGESEIDELNLRALNLRATQQGRHGEGHRTVRAGHTLALGPSQRRALALRQFLNTLEATSVGITATAQLFDERSPERVLNPSDYFVRLYHRSRRRSVPPGTFRSLHRETSAWLDGAGLWTRGTPDEKAVKQTSVAYQARRRPGKFGPYEFSLEHPPAKPWCLSATAWEKALRYPAEVWMRYALGVEASPEDADDSVWNLAIGKWAHRWMSAIPGSGSETSFAPLPDRDELLGRVERSSSKFCEDVIGIMQRCGRQVPDWWISLWDMSLRLANEFAERLAEVKGYSHIAAEWKLPSVAVKLQSGELYVSGRADTILATSCDAIPVTPWIIDYKTGGKKSLAPKSQKDAALEQQQQLLEGNLRKGDGLQLALYALALQRLGATAFGLTRLSPSLPLDRPQVTDVLLSPGAQARLWQGLCRMQDTGVFGMRGKLRDQYSFQRDYPLATLAIDNELLEEKWAQTHPELANGEEDEPQ